MFRCELTGRLSSPGAKPVRLVVERRHRSYDKTVYDLETRTVSVIPSASHGWEIVREVLACQSAAEDWIAKHPNGADWIDQPASEETAS